MVHPPTPTRRRGLFALAVLGVVAIHLGWFLYFVPTSAWLGAEPMGGVDYETHIGQTWRVLEGLEGWGRSWVYDAKLLAGSPQGLIFDADNKGWELWTWAVRGLGVSQGLAFNLFVVLAHWLVLVVVYASARLFELGRWAALAAAAMASALWWFDSFAHWCWWVGMVAYAIAGYLCLLPLALFWRWLRDRRTWQAVATAATLALAHQVHPYCFLVLAAPMLALYAMRARGLGWRGHAAVWGIALLTVVVNSWWLVPSIKYWHYALDSGFFGQAGPGFLIADLFGLMLDSATSGMIGTRTGFRFLVFGTCLVGLVLWRRARDPRFTVFAVALATLLALTYVGSALWILRQVQPYRHVLPLAIFAVIPAAAAIEVAVQRRLLAGTSRAVKVLLVLLAVPAAQHLASDVTYYLPKALPEVAPLYNGGWIPITAQGFGPQPEYRMRARTPDDDGLAAWVRSVDDGQSRFLIEEPTIGEELAWRTGAHVLGGFIYRNLQHSHANLFRRRKQGIAGDDELRDYFIKYAVGWVILSNPSPAWDRRPEVLELVARLGGHRLYRTKIAPSLLAEGTGRVTADTNVLRVTGSDPAQDLVLRFHWMETLVCAPDCAVRRVRVDSFDPVGFIKIPAPHPADLEVRNGY